MRFKSNVAGFLLLLFILTLSTACFNRNNGDEAAESSGPEQSGGFQLIATPGPELLRGNDALYGYEGVSFGYSSKLAQNVTGSKIPAYIDFEPFYTPGGPIRADMPDYVEITLQTEPFPARIGVQPMRTSDNQSFSSFSPAEIQQMSVIENDVGSRSGAADMVPTPPKLGYIQFANGTGRRYLTFKSTDTNQMFINNENLTYLFEGVTTDGRFLIWFAYPVSTSFLANPDPDAAPETILSQIDDLPSDLFTPNLAQLDAVVTSLQIEPTESFNYLVAAGAPDPGRLVVTLGDIPINSPPEVYAINQKTNRQYTGQLPLGAGLKQVTLAVPPGDYQVFAHVPGDVNGTFLGYWGGGDGRLRTITIRSGQSVSDPVLTLPDDPCRQILPATPDGKYEATNSNTFQNLTGCLPAVPSGRSTTYTVRTGDNLYRIGLSQGVNWLRIARVNGLNWPYTIYPDQQLIIPAP